MYLNNMTYDEVREDLIAFEKAHLNKNDNQQKVKKIVTFKSINGEEDDALDAKKLALIIRTIVENYKRSKN